MKNDRNFQNMEIGRSLWTFTKKIPLVMRLFIFYLFCSIGMLQAVETYAQNARLSLNVEEETVANVLRQIEDASDFDFFYNNSHVDLNRRVSVSAQNSDIFAILKEIFEGTEVRYTVLDKKIILSTQLEASPQGVQQEGNVVKGKVVDANGEPVIGATIKEVGTDNGTVTDVDGNFTIKTQADATLEVSFIGYQSQTLKAVTGKELAITLKEDTEMLDEVVVIGYGTAKKNDLAGSVVRADLSTLQESPSVSLGEALQGTIPGLNVGAVSQAGKDPEMSIRGRTSISGSNSPLIVLDGIIFRGNLVDINMNDVESIDVLKDASAAAIYGSEASNGVILITSKQGKTMNKPTIEYNGSFSFQAPTNNDMVPEGREGFLRKIADRYLEENRMGDDMLQMNPNWNVADHFMDSNVALGYENGTDTNWWNLLTVDCPYIQNHNISVRGNSKLSNYFFSVGYTDQQNLIVNDTYKRYNIRINLDTKIRDWLKVGTQSFFTLSDYSGASPDLNTVIKLPPLTAPYDKDNILIKNPYKSNTNPLQVFDQQDLDKRYNLFANFFVDINLPFIKGLNYRLNLSQNLILGKQFKFNEWGANFTGSGSKMNSSSYNYTIDNILTYKRTFNKHAVNATLVYGLEKRQFESTTAGAQNFTNFALGYNKLDMGQADLQTAVSSAWEEASLYAMARASYSYNDRYILTGTVRRDGFSGFGKNNKYGVFPSVALAWRMSEEEFIKNNINWIDNLKLRMSYGQNGNRTVGRYQTMAKMGAQTGYLFGDGASPEQMQWISSLPNADLKWETTNTFNVALDFSVLNNRLFGTLEYYRAQTNNLLYNINIPEINGLGSVPTNIGKLANKGFEMNITGIPVKTKDFQWDITFNFSRNRNKVKSILGLDNDGDGKEDDLVANKIFIGHPYGVCYDYNIIGMWQIADKQAGIIPDGFEYGTYKVEDIDGNGSYTADKDRKILGYTDPAYRFSIQNSLCYKNWEFKFMINSIQGGKDYYYGQPGASLPNPENIFQDNLFKFDYWTPENPNARYRKIGYYTAALGNSFSPYIQRNFVRLQDVTLSYNVPQKLLSKIHINRLKVYITGKNLLTLTDWDGWDPETGTGLTTNAYPVMRSYSFGINVEF